MLKTKNEKFVWKIVLETNFKREEREREKEYHKIRKLQLMKTKNSSWKHLKVVFILFALKHLLYFLVFSKQEDKTLIS